MPNTFDALRPVLFGAMRDVSRSGIGLLHACNTSFDSKGAAVGDVIKVPRVAAASNGDYTPAMSTTAGTDDTPTTDDVTVSRTRHNSFNIKHEDRRSLQIAGNYDEWIRLKTIAAITAIANEAEQDAWLAAYKASSRAHGTAGTAPFASDLSALAQMNLILNDNGCPQTDRHCVIDNTAVANLQTRTQLTNVADAGTDKTLREGEIGRLLGFGMHRSGQIAQVTKGTGAGYLADLIAGYAIGDRALHVDTGTGTILAGDIVTFTGDTNKYVNNTAFAGDGDGDIALGRPGLRKTLANDVAMTIGNSYTPNLCLHRNALAGVVRPPIIDAAPNMTMEVITDEESGLSILMIEIRGDGMDTMRAHLVSGFKAVSPEHIATLIG